jgi:putative copper export protein
VASGVRVTMVVVVALAMLAVGGAIAGGRASAEPVTALPTASSPAPNTVLGAPPDRIVIPRTGAAPGFVTVFDSNHKALAEAPARPVGAAMVATLPRLPRGAGVYSVVWHASGRSGAFAFQVSPSGASPALVEQPQPDNSLTPVREALPRYFAFAFIFIFIGTLALRFLVTTPTLRRLAGTRSRLAAAVDRRLLLTAGVTIALFIPATLLEFSNEEVSLWSTPDGHLWIARLALTGLAALAVVPAAAATLRRDRVPSARRVRAVAAIGLAAGVGELLARVIPTEAPEEWAREIFTDVLDWGHMTGASVWIGGLVALAVLAATLRRLPDDERDGFWSAALRRFSVVATVCVGVMILTGLWTAWIHVGPPRLLFHTLYGGRCW